MTQQGVLRRDDISDFISKMYEGDLHAKRVLSHANATLGVLTSASLAVHAIGRGLAQAMGRLSKHRAKQVDRLLSNDGIDVETFFGYWVAYMVGARSEIVVAPGWTSFARAGHETIVLSMLTGHGRTTPLMWRTVQASTLKGNQRRHSAMRIRHIARRDCLLLFSALSTALLTLPGAAGESLGYDRWLKANTVKTRTHSLCRQGLMLYQHIPNWPEHQLRPLFEKFEHVLIEQRVYREVLGVI